MVNYQFQAFANSNNTLLVGKMIAVTSLGLYAGTALTFNTVIMPSLRKFSSSSSLAIWHENFQVGKGKILDSLSQLFLAQPFSFPLLSAQLTCLL